MWINYKISFILKMLWYLLVQQTFTCLKSTIEMLEKRCMFKVNNKDTSYGVFIVNFGNISHLFLVSPLLTLDMCFFARNGFLTWSARKNLFKLNSGNTNAIRWFSQRTKVWSLLAAVFLLLVQWNLSWNDDFR